MRFVTYNSYDVNGTVYLPTMLSIELQYNQFFNPLWMFGLGVVIGQKSAADLPVCVYEQAVFYQHYCQYDIFIQDC